jgi:hypothetical protein
LGFDEKETIELNRTIRVGVRILRLGGFLSEISMMKNLKGEQTSTPIMRKLLVNPEYEIYVAHQDPAVIENVRSAVDAPAYPLYLGNTECLAFVRKTSEIERVRLSKDQKQKQLYSCTVPLSKHAEAIVRTDIKKARQVLYPPRTYRTIHSYKWTKKGRDIESFIRLLMFTGCQVELKKGEVDAYDWSGEKICLF